MNELKVTGHVKWFNSKSGYGFINKDNDSEKKDIFVHFKSIIATNANSLADGEEVLFDIVEGPKGLEAKNVTGPNGGDIVGGKPSDDKGKFDQNQTFENKDRRYMGSVIRRGRGRYGGHESGNPYYRFDNRAINQPARFPNNRGGRNNFISQGSGGHFYGQFLPAQQNVAPFEMQESYSGFKNSQYGDFSNDQHGSNMNYNMNNWNPYNY